VLSSRDIPWVRRLCVMIRGWCNFMGWIWLTLVTSMWQHVLSSAGYHVMTPDGTRGDSQPEDDGERMGAAL
jgi:hypothetical protein